MTEPWWKKKIADQVPVWSVLVGVGIIVGIIAAVAGFSLSGGTGLPSTEPPPTSTPEPGTRLKITDKVLFVHSL